MHKAATALFATISLAACTPSDLVPTPADTTMYSPADLNVDIAKKPLARIAYAGEAEQQIGDLRDGIEQFTAGSEEGGRDFGGTLGQLQEIGREVERGDLTEDQAEERIRELFVGSREGSDGEPLQITQDVQEDESITINIDGAELSADGDEVRIQID